MGVLRVANAHVRPGMTRSVDVDTYYLCLGRGGPAGAWLAVAHHTEQGE